MKLVDNWKSAWKWMSIRFIALAALWESIPMEAKAALEPSTQNWITLGLLVLAGMGRMIDQGTAK